ncbi:hypothetical protein RIF29_09656 [Crotalaria pallida]|uniref:Uncharacterized protein n=1 Tax=Crotalaria pallida TaxID=3830 RepID=A0AAN9FUX4_CROPI
MQQQKAKALELFLQDLCDRTYDITMRKGAKTMNAFHFVSFFFLVSNMLGCLYPSLYRKQCVQTCNVFDFLKDIVSKVPDLGGSAASGDDHAVTKRRKVAEDDDNDSDEEQKKSKMDLATMVPDLEPSGLHLLSVLGFLKIAFLNLRRFLKVHWQQFLG